MCRLDHQVPGGDPSSKRAKRPPNSRDGARCDTAFQKLVSRKVVTLCVPNSTRRSRVKQWWYFMMFGRVVFHDVRVVFHDYQILIPHTPFTLPRTGTHSPKSPKRMVTG